MSVCSRYVLAGVLSKCHEQVITHLAVNIVLSAVVLAKTWHLIGQDIKCRSLICREVKPDESQPVLCLCCLKYCRHQRSHEPSFLDFFSGITRVHQHHQHDGKMNGC